MTRRELYIAAAIAAGLLLGGGTVAISVVEEKRRVREALRKWAILGNLDEQFVQAIGYVESRWRMDRVNMSGADGARGGSWGPTQISELTARGHGYAGAMVEFTRDPDLAGKWTSIILNAHRRRAPIVTLADYVAAWNAGKDNADRNDDGQLEELPPSHSTRRIYLPDALTALALIRSEKAA